jgi:hypothetical protein
MSGLIAALALVSASAPASLLFSQCNSQITLVPLHDTKAATQARNFTRFRYSLSASDSLIIRSHEDTETTIGPYDTGFAITRDGKVTQRSALHDLSEFRSYDSNFSFSDGFTTLAVTRACTSEGPIYFVTMQWMGDITSPALVFAVIPLAGGYAISSFPSFSGGVVDVSRADPLHIRIWNNLHEGICNACDTHYKITEYEIRSGKPVKIRQYRTHHFYNSGDFDDERRIRFVP